MAKEKSKEYQKGYEDGRRTEAQVTLENLYIIRDQMVDKPHETDHILVCIRDLEEFLKVK